MVRPLEGIKVLEFTHAVMGPCAGFLMSENGAEVTLVEPTKGSPTRFLKGFGTGYFWYYNRNKKSLAIDIKSAEGLDIMYQLVKKADVVIENFGPGTMDRLQLGYDKLKVLNPKLIYCSLKGFLTGPYEKRHAMDEVVQMMGGLAYMTGRSGDPLRAGTSVVDITGGMFGYIGVLQALFERERTGEGKFIKSALFETCAFMVGQHMAYQSQVDYPIPPMPERISAWSVYKIFETADDDRVFIGIISDKHWRRFCIAFGWDDWSEDDRLSTNNGRIDEREWLLPELDGRIKTLTKADIISRCEQGDIPFAPISEPRDLFEDQQLNEGNSLSEVKMKNGAMVKLPKFPLEYGGERTVKISDPPEIGEHSKEILSSLNYTAAEIELFKEKNII
mgnify:CR=1 FL=1